MNTGYNCERIEELSKTISDVADHVAEDIVETLQNGVVKPMSTTWYAPDAVTFFDGVAETVKKSANSIEETFDNFGQNIENAGRAWADQTGGKRPNIKKIGNIKLKLDVSSILKDNAGNVTINQVEAERIASKLSSIEAELKSKLAKHAAQLQAETAFIGGRQADSIENCFKKITQEVSKIFAYLTSGENSLQSQIKLAAKNYGELSSTISSQFNSNN